MKEVMRLSHNWQKMRASNDGKEWTFFLKKGVKFSDGTPLMPKQLNSLDRLLTINQGPAWMFEMITAIDVLTNTLLSLPWNILFALHARISQPCRSVNREPQSSKDNEKDGDLGQAWLKQNAVGTGPYMLERWNIGQDLVLVKTLTTGRLGR